MKIQFSRFIVFMFATIAFATTLKAQTGKIAGKILDAKTSEELIGVTVAVEGTAFGAVTDYEGKFFIQNVKPGTYNLVISYVSYQKKRISGVEVKDKETTPLNITMEESKQELKEFVVQAELKKESSSALLVQQKNAISVSSGVSADLIRKTPDRTTADVIKRISGASIQDNKFAVIRGLSDRYNMGYLNGAPLPSTESDRKAFSLDIIPASVLDNMAIVKGASPDLPGDFAGGIIQINTKDVPTEDQISFNIAGQYHSLTTFKSGFGGNRSSTDWLGFDNGTRQLPGGLLSTDNYKSASETKQVQQTNLFNNNYSQRSVGSFRPNVSMQFSASKRMKLFKNDFGVIFAVSYNNSYKYTPFSTIVPADAATFNPAKSDGAFYNYDNYRNTVVGGAVLNFAYKIGQNSKFTFKNLLSTNSEDQTINQTGSAYEQSRQIERRANNYFYYYSTSRLISNQLAGEHFLPKSKIKIKYVGSMNTIHRELPDYRRVLYQSGRMNLSDPYSSYNVQATGTNAFSPTTSGRYFSKLDEKMYSVGADLAVPVKLPLVTKAELKFGGLSIWRDRSFNARNFLYATSNLSNDPGRTGGIDSLGPDKVFAKGNIDTTTHFLKETTQGTDAYTASSRLNAAYAMLDFKVKRLRVIGGARVEQFSQHIQWRDPKTGSDAFVDTNYVDILPSVNLIYELTEKVNVRGSASKTLSRPEFREFTPMAFYEINYNAIIVGNPALVKAQIYNYDFKVEYFPTAGQLFSINPFYKQFKNPVEAQSQSGNGGLSNFTYFNAPKAVNYGVEFEARATLASIFKNSTNNLIKNLSVFANYSLIHSEVTLNSVSSSATNAVNSRPLQGQSPYVFNAGLMFADPKRKFDVNLTVNRIGRRIAFVSDAKESIIYENPRTVLDMSISKALTNKIQMKLTFGDLLAQNLVFYQDINSNGKYDSSSDVTTFKYKFGRTIQIYFGYTF